MGTINKEKKKGINYRSWLGHRLRHDTKGGKINQRGGERGSRNPTHNKDQDLILQSPQTLKQNNKRNLLLRRCRWPSPVQTKKKDFQLVATGAGEQSTNKKKITENPIGIQNCGHTLQSKALLGKREVERKKKKFQDGGVHAARERPIPL